MSNAIYYYEFFDGHKGTWVCKKHSNIFEELKDKYPNKPVKLVELIGEAIDENRIKKIR